MPLTYGQILNQAALRIGLAGSIAGSTMATVESNYDAGSFGAAQLDSVRFPFSAQKDALQLAEEKIVSVIASIKDHPYRPFLSSLSANIANRGNLPTADAAGNKVVGVIGNVRDVTTDIILTEKGIEEVERLIRLQADVLAGNYYHFAKEGIRIIHTRQNVKAEVCTYNKTTQKTSIAGNLSTLLPDAFEELYICGEISYLFSEDETPATVQQYVQYFADGIARLQNKEIQ